MIKWFSTTALAALILTGCGEKKDRKNEEEKPAIENPMPSQPAEPTVEEEKKIEEAPAVIEEEKKIEEAPSEEPKEETPARTDGELTSGEEDKD